MTASADPSPAPPPPRPPGESLLNLPNVLSAARVPLAVVVFAAVVHQLWLVGLLAFAAATATDYLDGWWARRYGPLTLVGRNLDPLSDKVLVCGAFVYLLAYRVGGFDAWMVTVVVCREVVVTGIRGIVEATGQKFGADWFGKLKMGLQCAVLIGVFWIEWLRSLGGSVLLPLLEPVQLTLVWAMLAATVGSGAQYVVRAARMLS